MKKLVKILTLCAVMMFAMSFSAYGATKSEKASFLKLSDGTVVNVNKNFNGEIKSVQFLDGKKIESKNIQSMINAAKAKCLVNAATVDACTDAKVLAGLAVAGAALTCVTTAGVACVLASAAAIQAVKMMKDACSSASESLQPCMVEEARNRKFLIKDGINLNFNYQAS